MMKYLITALLLALVSCHNNNSQVQSAAPVTDSTVAPEKKQGFFPVTEYIKGQVLSIKEKGVTPVKYTTIKEHTDSVMVKLSELDGLVKEFVQPEIDSTNLLPFYAESSFLDQTLNAVTFSYDLKKTAPDTLQLRHWDVYVDPDAGKVKRVYIIKKAMNGKTLQLTWLHNKWFKTTILTTNPDGSTGIDKEEKVSWDY